MIEGQELTDLFRELRARMNAFRRGDYRSGKWTQWETEMRYLLRSLYGDDSQEVRDFEITAEWWLPQYVGTPTENQLRRESDFAHMLEQLGGWVDALILQIERFGIQAPARSTSRRRPMVFVAHGRSSKALTRLCEFLTALGCEPVVVEKMPSEGRSVNENVEYYLAQSDCGIVLATGDDLIGGKLYARPNVHIEAGRFQERFQSRVVYLLEQRATLPSNIQEKVYERFTRRNMTDAFIKVSNELRAFGYLLAYV